MGAVILACHTLEAELLTAIEKSACEYPVRWVRSGLHNSPDLLREHIQKELDGFTNVHRFLLLFGFCGNALLGIRTQSFEIVFPRVDDCITLLLGSHERRASVKHGTTSFFLTQGWLDHERNIWKEYQYSIEKFGEKMGMEINTQILRHYTHLMLIDTGSFDLTKLADKTKRMADTMGLQHSVVGGTTEYIEKLLTGPHDGDFVTIPPDSLITQDHLG
jgi:hypothetical protein